MPDDPAIESHPQWYPHFAVAGWVLPGLGHILLGQRVRGVVIMIAVTGLYLGGILIGGISVIDHLDRTEPQGSQASPGRSWWYFGQALVAPTLVVNKVRQRMLLNHLEEHRIAGNGDPRALIQPKEVTGVEPPYEPSLGRMMEQGILYTALAGMLNLLAIIDVLYCDPNRDKPAARPVPEPA